MPSPPSASVTSLALVGGGARSGTWAQLLASTLNVTLVRPQGGSAGAALGAARLAMLACDGDVAHVCSAPPMDAAFEPDAAEHARLAERHARFARLYPAVAREFAAA